MVVFRAKHIISNSCPTCGPPGTSAKQLPTLLGVRVPRVKWLECPTGRDGAPGLRGPSESFRQERAATNCVSCLLSLICKRILHLGTVQNGPCMQQWNPLILDTLN